MILTSNFTNTSGKKGTVKFNTKLNNSISKGIVYGVPDHSMVLLHLTAIR